MIHINYSEESLEYTVSSINNISSYYQSFLSFMRVTVSLLLLEHPFAVAIPLSVLFFQDTVGDKSGIYEPI